MQLANEQSLKTAARQKVDDYETHLKKELGISDIENWKSALANLKQKPNQEQVAEDGIDETKLKAAQNKYLAEKARRKKTEKQLREIKIILNNLQGKENIPPTEWQEKWNELLVIIENNSPAKKPPQLGSLPIKTTSPS